MSISDFVNGEADEHCHALQTTTSTQVDTKRTVFSWIQELVSDWLEGHRTDG
jgi:hypothetical protein